MTDQAILIAGAAGLRMFLFVNAAMAGQPIRRFSMTNRAATSPILTPRPV
jgi:hypothetical protein